MLQAAEHGAHSSSQQHDCIQISVYMWSDYLRSSSGMNLREATPCCPVRYLHSATVFALASSSSI